QLEAHRQLRFVDRLQCELGLFERALLHDLHRQLEAGDAYARLSEGRSVAPSFAAVSTLPPVKTQYAGASWCADSARPAVLPGFAGRHWDPSGRARLQFHSVANEILIDDPGMRAIAEIFHISREAKSS